MSKDILTLAREAGFLEHEGTLYTNHKFGDCFGELERFAELVRTDERNRTWTQQHWTEYEHNIRNATLDEIATKIEAMPFGDTAASFAVWIKEQKT